MSKFLIYKSSAGSGKTTTLIYIFLKLSLASNDANRFKKILAITFTNKAANEMKERLIFELNKISTISDDYQGGDFVIDGLLKDLNIDLETLSQRALSSFKILLHDYNDLSIGTIDQFNHRLIRSFSRDLRLKSDFEVELDQKSLFHEAVMRLIDRVGDDPYITTHLLGYLDLKVEDEKGVDIARDLESMRNLVFEESALEALSVLQNQKDLDFVAIRKDVYLKHEAAREAIQAKGKEGLQFLSDNNLEINDFSRKDSGYGGYFLKMANYPDKEPIVNSYILKALEGELVPKAAPADLKSKVQSLEPQLISKLRESISVFESNHGIFTLSKALLAQIDLIAVLEELNACIDEICEERNILPISKFNKLISEALRKEPVAYLYEHYGMRFNHILIDEFQDTSELQWFNILPLIEEALSKGQTSMVVGDAKQSIYSWRGGKAEQLIALPDLISPPEDLRLSVAETIKRTAEITELATNYRSRINIVNFNNAFFSQLGTQLTHPDSLYEKEYLEKSVSQKSNPKLTDGYVRIDYLGVKPETEAKWEKLLENIALFTAQGYSYGDMAILVRQTSKEGRQILNVLQAADIPVATANSFEIDKNIQVKLILAFLRLAYDPQNTAAKISVMRSMETIFQIPFEPHLYVDSNGVDLNGFLKKHNKPVFRGLKNSEGIYELTERLIADYLPNSRNSFLNALLNTIVNRVGLNGTCREFFDWWDTLIEKPSVSGSDTSDAIQLMTIHKSKGLQFKVVFVPDIDWRFRARNNELKWFDLRNNPISTIPFAPLPLNNNLNQMGFADEWQENEDALKFDNLNLIYVALTRAEEALCISYSLKDKTTIGLTIKDAIENIRESKLALMPEFKSTDYGDSGETIEIGILPQGSKADTETVEGNPIEWIVPDNEPWFTKVLTAPQIQKSDRIRGVHFHSIISMSRSADEAKTRLDRLMAGGGITAFEHEDLSRLIENLYSDNRFVDLLKSSKVLAERELYFNAEILRPDMVLETADHTVLIDFKTGEEDEKYEAQVGRYGAALQQMSTKPVKAYLLYISPISWVEVPLAEAPRQTSLF